jgi:hypothetical protein
MRSRDSALSRREYRIGRRLRSRGETALFECLLAMRGKGLGLGMRLGALHAVGGEGALFRTVDPDRPAEPLIAKVGLAAWHRPIKLTSKAIRARRAAIEREAAVLTAVGSRFFPKSEGLRHFENPHLEGARGGEFAKLEPCLVMERLPGQDLDAWLCRVHRGYLQWMPLRRALDRLAVAVLRALADVEGHGRLYADLRPGNLRVVGRPTRGVRLLDAGACVPVDDPERRFPHVPSYLPPEIFWALNDGERRAPTRAVQAVMAGRTLAEVATGQTPQAGAEVDATVLFDAPISKPVAETIAALCRGDHPDCRGAFEHLVRHARQPA